MVEIIGLLIVFILGYFVISLPSYGLNLSEKITIKKGFWVGLTCRVGFTLLLFILTYAINWKYTGVFLDDAFGYDQTSWSIAQSWRTGNLLAGAGKNGFYFFNAAVYSIFGHHLLVAKFFNALMGAFIPILVYLMAREVYKRRVAKFALWLSVLSPILIYWSGDLVKDSQVTLFTLVAIWSVLKLEKGIRLKWAVLFAFSLTYLFSLRNIYGFMMVGLYLLYLGMKFLARKERQKIVAITVVVGLILIGISSFSQQIPILRDFDIERFQEQLLQGFIRRWAREGISEYHETHPFLAQTPFSPINIGYTLARSLFIPTILTTTKQMVEGHVKGFIYFPLSIFWMLVSPLWILGLYETIRKKFTSSFLLYGTSLAIFVGSSIAFLGAAVAPLRYRAPAHPIFMIFAGYGLFMFQTNPSSRKTGKIITFLYFFVLALVLLLYAEFYTGLISTTLNSLYNLFSLFL